MLITIDENDNEDTINKKLKIITEHKPVSVSINSNVPGYDKPIFICNDNAELLIDEFVNTIHKIALKAESINKQKYFHIIEFLDTYVENVELKSETFVSSNDPNKNTKNTLGKQVMKSPCLIA